MILDAIRFLAMLSALARGAVMHPRETVPPTTALIHAMHAERAATTEVPARVLFYLGYRESRFKRQYHPGRGQCGVTQIETYQDVKLCRTLADDHAVAYRMTTEHLTTWLRLCRGRGLACALTGYADGTEAALVLRDYRAARRSLRMASHMESGR